jgi:hypothetical protein
MSTTCASVHSGMKASHSMCVESVGTFLRGVSFAMVRDSPFETGLTQNHEFQHLALV